MPYKNNTGCSTVLLDYAHWKRRWRWARRSHQNMTQVPTAVPAQSTNRKRKLRSCAAQKFAVALQKY